MDHIRSSAPADALQPSPHSETCDQSLSSFGMPNRVSTSSPSSSLLSSWHSIADPGTPNTPFYKIELGRYDGSHKSQIEWSGHNLLISQSEDICEQCRRIDFHKVTDLPILTLQSSPNGILIADFGMRCNLAPKEECRLCQILHRSRYNPKNSIRQYQLRAYSYLKSSRTISFGTYPKSQLERDIPCLGVVPAEMSGSQFRLRANDAGHLFCLEDGQPAAALFTRRLLGVSADFSQFKEWLNFCKSFHTQCQGTEDQVDGLKVIGCYSGSIIAAPLNVAYVALSYVWGQSNSGIAETSTGHSQFKVLGPGFTKTIQDAILATKSLGYQYLWVDKFCIDQNNPEEKHHQISQMDTIYKAAEVTIIASSGHNCYYGLPGVGRTPRKSQDVVKCGKFKIISTMTHPHQQIPTSPWAARAWTLQEAVLSRRRLVFTDDQVYFECTSMNCSETLSPSLDLIHRSDKKATYPCFHSGILSCNTGRRFAHPEFKYKLEMLRHYMELVSQYSRRALTFEEDRLKAFIGIIRHFTRNRLKIFQLCGVPYYDEPSEMLYETFLRGLLWAHKESCDLSAVNPPGGLIEGSMTS